MTHDEFAEKAMQIGKIHYQMILEAKTDIEKMNIFEDQIHEEQALLLAYEESQKEYQIVYNAGWYGYEVWKGNRKVYDAGSRKAAEKWCEEHK